MDLEAKNLENLKDSKIWIANYQDEKVKEIVKKNKNLDKEANIYMANELYTYIVSDMTANNYSETRLNTLLLHAPSSSFARGDKSKDHMTIILEEIKNFADMQKIIKIDIFPHFFIIDADKRKSQHQKDRSMRITDSKTRFNTLSKIDQNFMWFIQKYDSVYIIDDVLTTGATLTSLASLLRQRVKESEKLIEIKEIKIPDIRLLTYCH